MLAQSLFASVQPAAVQAGGVAVPAADDAAFGRLIDQATRPAPRAEDAQAKDAEGPRPEILPALPDEDGATKPADGQGPQILPGASTPPPRSKTADAQPRPQILPGLPDEGATPDLSAKPSETGPQILPDAQDADRATPLPKAPVQDDGQPRPEVLPFDVGPTPSPVETVAKAPPPSPEPAASIAQAPGAPPSGATTPLVATPDRRASQLVADAQIEAASEAPSTTAPAAAPAATSGSPAVTAAPAPAPAPAATLIPQPSDALRAETAAQGPSPEAPPTSEVAAPSADAPAFSLSRVAHETLADLSAQIVRRLEGKYTRFEMALTPDDLGRVDVSLEMGEDGSLTARLAFDSPLAAAEMRARADELRRQLEQAGFQLARDALDFGQRDASSGRHDGFERRSNRAFAAARALADRVEAAPLINLSLSLSPARDRVDVKV